jgi:hypothetical protein
VRGDPTPHIGPYILGTGGLLLDRRADAAPPPERPLAPDPGVVTAAWVLLSLFAVGQAAVVIGGTLSDVD